MNHKPNSRVTMHTLAEILGVTKTTVSLALRNNRKISRTTRERVTKLAQELNYRPDPSISVIASSRWNNKCASLHQTIIGFLCHRDSNNKINRIQLPYLAGASKRAEELGYKLEPFVVDDYPNAQSVSRVLYSRGIRGLIIPPIPHAESKQIMQLDWNKFTAVCCGIGHIHPPLHAVTNDILYSVRTVWEEIVKNGFDRIGLVINDHEPASGAHWLHSGASAKEIRFLGLETNRAIPCLIPEDEACEATLIQWYKRHKPDIIIASSHHTGETLARNGIRIPDDVELICLASPASSKWSGLTHHIEPISRTSVDVLNTELRNNHWGLPDIHNTILIEPSWNPGLTFRKSRLNNVSSFTNNGIYAVQQMAWEYMPHSCIQFSH